LGLQDSLSRLAERISEPPHAYRPSILSFLQLNVQKGAKDLKLAERGRERGARNEPSADSEALDDVENEVIEFIEGEVKKAHAALLDDLSTYAHRLHALDLEGRFSTIEAAAMDGISSFRSEVSRGLDSLSSLGRRLSELEQEMRDFRSEHGLRRTAHYPSIAGKVWRWGLIALLFLAEVAGNSYFLAKGSAYGLIGGFAEAVIIAFLNLGVAMAIGFFGLRQAWHRALWRKTVGFLSLLAWLAFATSFNLFVAHYREAAGVFLEGGGAIALQALKAAPFGLTDFQSWVLFGIGALFAFIALVDSLSMDDLYPFYGTLDRTLEDARAVYAEERDELIAELEEIKAATIRAMQSAKDDLGKRRGEHGSILEGRSRAQRAYEQHLNYIERAGNSLLSIYREAHRQSRNGACPKRFNEAWTVIRPPVEAGPPPDVLPQEKLEAAVARAQTSLDERMREVHAEYERAFRAYRGLDDFAGVKDGQTASSAR
jgi:hypothetical protein